MENDVTLRSGQQFTGNNPTFTLEARTSGGPPTTSTWTRDGVEITSGISLALDTVLQSEPSTDNLAAYQNARCRSDMGTPAIWGPPGPGPISLGIYRAPRGAPKR